MKLKIKGDYHIPLMIGLIFLILTFFDICVARGIFESTIKYIVDSTFRTLILEKYHGFFPYIIHLANSNIRYFDVTIIWGTRLYQVYGIILCAMGSLWFYNQYSTIYTMKYYRYKNKEEIILKDIITHALIIALVLLGAFTIVYLIILYLTECHIDVNEFPRTLFLDWFSIPIHQKYPIIYYYMDGLVRFFLFPFIYSFLGNCLAVVLKDKWKVFFSTIFFYFGIAIISFLVEMITPYVIYFNPSVILASGAYTYLNTTILLLSQLIVPLIGLGIFHYAIKTKKV